MGTFSYRDLRVQAGTRGFTRLPVARLAGGYELTLPLHVVHGTRPGPTLLVVGVVHGDEIFATDVIRLTLDQLDPDSLAGTLLALPVANPAALAAQTRNTPLDMLDLNRQFPGEADGWLSQRIAAAVAGLVDEADCLLHLDGGTTDRIIHYVSLKSRSDSAAADSERLAKAFGLKMLYRGAQAPGTVTSYAAERGIPSVLAEIGGALLYTDPVYMRRAVTGVGNVMRGLDMLAGQPESTPGQQIMNRRVLVRVPEGGIFHPAVGLTEIDRPIPGGTLLGTVVDPYTLVEVARIEAPYPRSVLFQMRVLPSAVQPGDYAFIIGDLDSAEVP